MTDFLEEPKAYPMSGLDDAVRNGFGMQFTLLADIKRELLKNHPEVMALTKVQGSNPINDVACHKIYFEIGGKAVIVHRIIAWSSYDGTSSASVVSFGNTDEGFTIPATPIILDVSVDSLYVMTDGANPVNINGGVTTHGGIYIYGFAIPDYDRHIDRPIFEQGNNR